MRRTKSGRRWCDVRLLLEHLEDRTLPSSYTAATVADLLAALTACNTAGGTNSIALTAPSTSPYVLTAALPDVAAGNDLTITGNGDMIERSTDPSTPAFGLLVVDPGASLSVQNLTLENGEAPIGSSGGGGILNQGILTVENCVITGNTAQDGSGNLGGGGIANLSGTLTVDHCTVSNNTTPGAGGGLLNEGTLIVTFSTIAGNTANAGAGVANLGGSVTISSSTISDNSAANLAEGSASDNGMAGAGAGIWDAGDDGAGFGTTLVDSTLANNVAFGSGGAIEAQDTVTIAECTIAGNSATYGGGIDNYFGNYSISVVNTLFANNSASNSGPDFQNGAISQGYNLVDDTDGSSGFGATGDLLDLNADLGPLADNGGPTQTIALSTDSPALAVGNTNASLPATDQRGDPRTRDGTVDIGAYEAPPAPNAFQVSGFPTVITAGTPGTVTITALNPDGTPDTSYNGAIHFTSSDPDAILPPDTTLTDGTGTFSVTFVSPGIQTLTVSDKSGLEFPGSETNIAVAAVTFKVSGFPTAITADTPGTVTVTALNPDGTPDIDYSGTVHFTSSDPNTVVPPDTTLTGGIGTFSVTFADAGVQSLTVTDTTDPEFPGSETNIAVAPVTFQVTGFPTAITAGTPGTVTVTALNPDGTPDTSYSGNIQFTSSDPNAVLPPDTTLTGGTGTFSATFETVGVESLAATDTNDPEFTGSETNITVAPGFQVSGFPTAITAGTPGTVTVTALNPDGTPDTSYSGTVQFTSSDPNAILPPDITLTDGTGAFSITFETAAVQSLTVTDTSNPGFTGSETNIAVAPGPATQLIFAAGPQQAQSADQVLTTVIVNVADAFGNIETDDNRDTVSLSVTGPGGFTADSQTTAAVINGVATFTDLQIETPGSYQGTASCPGLAVASAPLTVVPGAPSQLAFVQPPTGGTAGQPLAPVEVEVLDSVGNLVTDDYSDLISLTLSSLSGPETYSADSMQVSGGVAIFADPAIGNGAAFLTDAVGQYQLVAFTTYSWSPNLTESTAPITIQPGPAAGLAFFPVPSAGTVGQPLGALQATLVDEFGNTETGANGDPVSLTVSGPGNFVAGSTTSAALVNGVATFSPVALDTAGSYVLEAWSPSAPEPATVSLVIGAAQGQPDGTLLRTATPLVFTAANTASADGFLADPGQFHLYSLSLNAGDTIDVRASGQQAGSGLDPLLRLFNAQGGQVLLDDQEAGDAEFTFQAATAGDYFLGISSTSNDDYNPTVAGSGRPGGTTGLYTLSVLLTPGAVPQADLEAASLRVGAAAVAWGDTVPLTFSVENRGGADAGNFTALVVVGAEDGSNDLLNSEVLQSVSVPGLAAGQGFSWGPICVTLPNEDDSFVQNIRDFATAFLQIAIVSDASQYGQAALPPLRHRGEDWDPLTVATPVTADSPNFSVDTAYSLEDPTSSTDPNFLVTGTVSPGVDEWYEFSPNPPAGSGTELTATVTVLAGAPNPQLVLYNDGQLLAQSDQTAPGSGEAQIILYLPAQLDGQAIELEVVNQGAGGSYQLLVQQAPAQDPFQPLAGSSQEQQDYSYGYAPSTPVRALVVADVKGDGRPDLIASTPQGLSVLTNNGNGTFQTFQPPYSYSYSYGNGWGNETPVVLAVGDLSGDGNLEAVAANSDQTLNVFPLSDPGSSNDLANSMDLPDMPAAMVLADLTNNGLPDLITANTDGTVSLYMNEGYDSFDPNPVYLNVGSPGFGDIQSLNFLAVADVNGDGNPDLLVPMSDGTIHLLVGNGDGTFQTPQVIPVGEPVISLTVADLTGSGRPDLIATTFDSTTLQGTVTVLMNQGNGNFHISQVIAVGATLLDSVGVGDFNGDGRLDIAATGSGEGFVFLSNGDGTFRPPLNFAVPDGNTTLAVADLTGNGRPDLLVNTYCDFQGLWYGVSVYLGNGDGTFQTAPTMGAVNVQSQALVDLTGDGHPDIVATRSDGVVELLGNGDGTFQPAQLIALGQSLVGVTDLNGDGRPDLVTNKGIMLGDGDGIFQPLELVAAGQTILAVDTLTADGIPDLIVGNADGTLGVRMGNGDGTFQAEVLIPGVTDVQQVLTADVTGDGIPDLVVADDQADVGGEVIQVLVGNGDGTFQPPSDSYTTPLQDASGAWIEGQVMSIQAASFDENSPPDLVVNSDGFSSQVLDNDGSGHFSVAASFALNVTVGDVFGNGHLDLITYEANSQSVIVVPGNGDGTFQDNLAFTDVPSGILSAVAADVTGNGLADLVTNQGVFLSNGDGTFSPALQAGGIAHNDTPHLVDLDGDGVKDNVVLDSSGDILFRKGLAGGQFAPPIVLNPGRPATDLAVVNIGTGWALAATDAQPVRALDGSYTYDVSLYTLNPEDTVNRTIAFSTSQEPEQLAAGDLTGAGLDDLVATNPASNSVTIALQTAPGMFGIPIVQPVGDEPSAICMTDVTGNGQLDIVVANQGDDTVTVLYNDATNSFANSATFRAGTSLAEAVTGNSGGGPTSLGEPISLVAGDFTGDGRNDLVVVDRATHSFTVLPNDGNGGFANPEPGLTTSTSDGMDVNEEPGPVVAGYFNGPNRPLDLAILMEDTGQVWIYTGDGQGHFTHTASIPAGDPPTGLTLVPGSAPGLFDLVVGNSSGDVLTLVADGKGSFQPVTQTYHSVALAVEDLANGEPEALVADQETNQVSLQTPASTGPQFTPVQTLTVADATTQLAPGAVQWARLDEGSPYEDAVVVCSGSNDVLVYRCTGFDDDGQPTFTSPVAYPVGDNPVSVTIANVTGNGIPDLLVANQGSNDISVLFGAYAANGNWIARDGPRLKSGGEGPVSVAVRYQNGKGLPDLVVTNGQSGDFTVLPDVGQGFFNDQNPQVFNIPGNPVLEAPSFFGTSDQGVATTADGRLIGFDLSNFAASVATVFAPPAGEEVDVAEALPDGHVVAALASGAVVDLAPSGGGLVVDRTFQSLTGIPSDPCALAVLQSESGMQVLVTDASGDRVFVFGIPGLPESPTLPPAEAPTGPLVEVTPPEGGSLTLVVTLIAGALPDSAVVAETAQTPGFAANLFAGETPPQAAGPAVAPPTNLLADGAGEALDELAAPAPGSSRPGEGGIDPEQKLRDRDLYQPTPDPDRLGLSSRRPEGPGRNNGVVFVLARDGCSARVAAAGPTQAPTDAEPADSWAEPAEVVRVVAADPDVWAQTGAREADAVFVLEPPKSEEERWRILALAGFAGCTLSRCLRDPERPRLEARSRKQPPELAARL